MAFGLATRQLLFALAVSASVGAAQAQSTLSLRLDAASLPSCSETTGTITLTPAPPTGAVVRLLADSDAVRIPATVAVPPAATEAAFSVTASPVRAPASVQITVFTAGLSASATLAVLPVPAYSVEDLGTLGGAMSMASAINASGQVAGVSETADGRLHAFRTDAAGVPRDIAPESPDAVIASAINASGQVAGWVRDTTGARTAFSTDASGALSLVTAAGAVETMATGISATGDMSGTFVTVSGERRAFFKPAGDRLTDLGTFANGAYSYAFGLTDDGTVVGFGDDNNHAYAFRTRPGGALSDATKLGDDAYAYAVNASGTVAGEAFSADGYFHAFRSRPDGSVQDLGTLGAHDAAANALNARGDTVGVTYVLGGPEHHAFLYTDDGGLRDLNDLLAPGSGWELTSATGINDAGQIAGYGRHEGAVRAFRLTPSVPPAPYGDVDGSGTVDQADAAALLRASGGLSPAGAILASDVAPSPSCSPQGFGNGWVGVEDAVRTLRRARGLEPVWP